jgi:hypothetical protein
MYPYICKLQISCAHYVMYLQWERLERAWTIRQPLLMFNAPPSSALIYKPSVCMRPHDTQDETTPAPLWDENTPDPCPTSGSVPPKEVNSVLSIMHMQCAHALNFISLLMHTHIHRNIRSIYYN